jgi:hypothetical protein
VESLPQREWGGVNCVVNSPAFTYIANASRFSVVDVDWIFASYRQPDLQSRKEEKNAGTANEPPTAVATYRTSTADS